jgi:uncharacterized protein (DUF111 family)
MTASNSTPSSVVEIAVNLDDVSGQVLGDAQQRLMEAGALDVWTVPIGMKKQRPGAMLCLLCEPGKRDELARLVLQLTGAFGVRFRGWDRLVLQRTHQLVQTRFGPVRLKVGWLDGELIAVQPEYEDVRKLSETNGVAVRETMRAAQAAADEWRASNKQPPPDPSEAEA